MVFWSRRRRHFRVGENAAALPPTRHGRCAQTRGSANDQVVAVTAPSGVDLHVGVAIASPPSTGHTEEGKRRMQEAILSQNGYGLLQNLTDQATHLVQFKRLGGYFIGLLPKLGRKGGPRAPQIPSDW